MRGLWDVYGRPMWRHGFARCYDHPWLNHGLLMADSLTAHESAMQAVEAMGSHGPFSDFATHVDCAIR